MLSHSPEEATDILVASADHRSLGTRRTVAENLSRIHSQEATLLLLGDRLSSETDESIQTLCASFVGGLAASPKKNSLEGTIYSHKGNQKQRKD